MRASEKMQILRHELIELNQLFIEWAKSVKPQEGVASLEREMGFLEEYIRRMRKLTAVPRNSSP